MSNDEHLIENILTYIENIGWQKFDEDNPEDLKKARKNIDNSDLVNDEVFLWLLKMAVYIEYQKDVWRNE